MANFTVLQRHAPAAAVVICLALIAGLAGTSARAAQSDNTIQVLETEASYEACVTRCAFTAPVRECVGDCAQQHDETAPADSTAVMDCISDAESCSTAADACLAKVEDPAAYEACLESDSHCREAAESCLSEKDGGRAAADTPQASAG